MLDAPRSFALTRLLQLVSPTLPVGAYAYSQGMEKACESGLVVDAATAAQWIQSLLRNGIGWLDLPIGVRLYGAWEGNEIASVQHWNHFLQASRESKELLAEDRQLGAALVRVLDNLQQEISVDLDPVQQPSFLTIFTAVAVAWRIPLELALTGFAFAWCENQVTAAIKLIPLGQTHGQNLLLSLGDEIESLVLQAIKIADDDIGRQLPMVAMMSSLHETQYSRLFRS